jgi:hypothetical protein
MAARDREGAAPARRGRGGRSEEWRRQERRSVRPDAGATNRGIGGRLHVAEKTASVHVSRILAKLNVRSRTEAAAVAHRQGLADTAPIG